MNLSKYEMDESGVLHLKDAADELMYADGEDGKPDQSKPMRIHLWGPGSKQYARASNARANHHIDLLKAKGKVKESADEAAKSNAQFLAGCTKGFENIEGEPGQSVEDIAIAIYSNQRLSFIRDQVAVFIGETQNFTRSSSAH